MAQRTTVTVLDDLERAQGKTVTAEHPDTMLKLDGKHYEIDLSAANYQALTEALEPFIRAGRRVTRAGGVTGRRPTTAEARERNQIIREWAAANGWGDQVAERGRIPGHVIEAYEKGQRNGDAPAAELPVADRLTGYLDGIKAREAAQARHEATRRAAEAEPPAPSEPPHFATQREANQAIREYVRKQGITVSQRGAIPKEFRQIYAEAHGGDPIVDE